MSTRDTESSLIVAAGTVEQVPLEQATTVIRPTADSLVADLVRLYRHRSVFYNLLQRDLRRELVEQRLGFLWVFARPLLMTVVFVLFRYGTQANVAVDIPYPLFLFAGLVFWFTWADAVASVAAADRMNASLLSKVYFPRLYSPLSLALSRTAKLLIGIVPIALLLLYYGIRPGWHLALLPLVLGQAMLLAFAVGTLFAVLAIGKPEWDNVLSLILYVGLFVSPVIYAARVVPGHVYSVYGLNPMIGTLGAFRGALIGDLPFPWSEWAYACAFTLAAALAATVLFKRAETRILDDL